MAFFPEEFDLFSVVISVVITLLFLVVGVLMFRRLERPVLKEL